MKLGANKRGPKKTTQTHGFRILIKRSKTKRVPETMFCSIIVFYVIFSALRICYTSFVCVFEVYATATVINMGQYYMVVFEAPAVLCYLMLITDYMHKKSKHMLCRRKHTKKTRTVDHANDKMIIGKRRLGLIELGLIWELC